MHAIAVLFARHPSLPTRWFSAAALLLSLALPAWAQSSAAPAATGPVGTRYAWVDMPGRLDAEADPRVQDPAFRQHLQAALDKALAAKGYTRVPASQAQLFVAYRVGLRDIDQVTVRDTAPAGGATPQAALQCKGGQCSQLVVRAPSGTPVLKTSVTHETEGGLLVEMLEARGLRVVWRGMQRGAVKRGDAAQPRLDAIATATLASLPKAKTAP